MDELLYIVGELFTTTAITKKAKYALLGVVILTGIGCYVYFLGYEKYE